MKTILTIMLAILMVGCGPPMSELLDRARTQNRESLTRLSIGMTKAEVLEIMGTRTWILKEFDDTSFRDNVREINNPYRVEAVTTDDGEVYEILFYYTDIKESDGVITDDELTPLVIKDNKLIGWGWTFVNDSIKKYQIDVR